MLVNTNNMVAMTKANQNFSQVVHLVDEGGMAVILKNNKPRYVVVGFEEYDALQAARRAHFPRIAQDAEPLLDEKPEALRKLAR